MDRLQKELLLSQLSSEQDLGIVLHNQWMDSVQTLVLARKLTMEQAEAMTVDRFKWMILC